MQHSHLKPNDAKEADIPWDDIEAQWLSALVDGELPAEEFTPIWAQLQQSQSAAVTWHAQHLIGDILRRDFGVCPSSATANRSQAFAQRVVSSARARNAALEPLDSDTQSTTGVSRTTASLQKAERTKQPAAANDDVFRWKAVAGLASLSAVLSLVWNMWTVSDPGASPSLAKAGPERVVPADAVAVAQGAASSTLLVATERGVIERDARLDALIQAHRQHGGGTALQVPAGFMRAATQTTRP